MKEQNKNKLDRAIKQLPSYKAPAKFWKGIEWGLDQMQSEEVLQQSIEELPKYEAPDQVWDNIDQQLQQIPEQNEVKLSWFSLATRAAAAAAVIGLAFIGMQWLVSVEKETIAYSYSVETVDEQLLNADWDEDEMAFEMITEFCKTQQVICEEPLFRSLQDELEELNTAKADLLLAMEHYGKDAEMVAQITRLEHERSDILKQMLIRI